MAKFLNLFPKTLYDIDKKTGTYSNFDIVTNITFRFGIIKDVLSNISAYFKYAIHDGERPEMVAERVYGDPEAYWIILYSNDMYDPQYDWPLDYASFQKFIINKYGSLAYARTNVHHYEKVITRTESLTGLTTTQKIVVDYDKKTSNTLTIPYDYYLNLPDNSVTTYNADGQTITEVISRAAISYFDYENELNDNKRLIKVIKPDYYTQIIREFDNMTGNVINPYLKKFTTSKQ